MSAKSPLKRLGIVMALVIAGAGLAKAENASTQGAAFLSFQKWLFEADRAAIDMLTYEICGWGVIDLRTPLLQKAVASGMDPSGWRALAQRIDESVREARRNEALQTGQGTRPPSQRSVGLHGTNGCAPDIRYRIEAAAANAP